MSRSFGRCTTLLGCRPRGSSTRWLSLPREALPCRKQKSQARLVRPRGTSDQQQPVASPSRPTDLEVSDGGPCGAAALADVLLELCGVLSQEGRQLGQRRERQARLVTTRSRGGLRQQAQTSKEEAAASLRHCQLRGGPVLLRLTRRLCGWWLLLTAAMAASASLRCLLTDTEPPPPVCCCR